MSLLRTKVVGKSFSGLGVCLPADVVNRGGQGTLNLEERVIKVFDELRLPVYRYLVCIHLAPQDAEEIVQETFLRLYKHLHSGGRENNLRGWVFRVAHNIGINRVKGHRFVTAITAEQWADLIESATDPAPGPEELALKKEIMMRVQATVSALSPQQQQCLHLRIEGFRYREIAEILGISMSSVQEFLRRAVEKLTREANG